jgi:transposase
MNITTLGIDLAKNIFQLHGVDEKGKAILKKTLTRKKLLEFVATLSPCQIVMEACGGSNYWARAFSQHGHKVKLISPQFVKPFVKSNKNDRNDAEAIVEAASRPSMRYVSPKSMEQQDLQSLLRLREACVGMRTKISNQLRGLLAEYGLVMPQGISYLRTELPILFDRGTQNELSNQFKELLESQYHFFLELEKQIAFYEKKLKLIAKTNITCRQLQKIEGVGPIGAIAVLALVGNPHDFKNGRHFSAFLGLVPRQSSSGGRQRLLGISKRGDTYVRTTLIHGARSIVLYAGNKTDPRDRWINALRARAGFNRTCVAVANKNARIILAMLKSKEEYKPAA